MWIKMLAAAGMAAVAGSATACSSSSSSGGAGSGTPSTASASAVGTAGSGALKTANINGVTVVTNAQGFTLYSFAPDTASRSVCNGACAQYWPPVTGRPTAGPGVTGRLGTITRSDGSAQATYDGHPLYTYVGDKGLVINVPRNYRNAWVFRVGGEYVKPAFLPPLTLRAGILRSVSKQPSDTISPSLTDGNSWAVSVGAGYDLIPNLRADIAYQVAVFDKATASGPDAFPGSYDTHVHLVSLGVNYRLPNL